jgi:hypothetical protein
MMKAKKHLNLPILPIATATAMLNGQVYPIQCSHPKRMVVRKENSYHLTCFTYGQKDFTMDNFSKLPVSAFWSAVKRNP